MACSRIATGIVFLGLGCLLVVACSGDQFTAGIDRGGVRVPVAASGPITAFGSIFVNGVRFDIDSAQIDVNGVTAAQADLSIGQQVSIVGEIDSDGIEGLAARVVFESNVTGTIESVDPIGGNLLVLGQTVLADGALLEFGPRAPLLNSLVPGDRVEVSGYTAADGVIVATRVALDNSGFLRVRGTVSNLDPVASSFTINSLVVDYRAAGLIEGFRTGQPSGGDIVVAVGTNVDGRGALLASQIRLFESFTGNAGEEAEVESLITRFVSPDDFDVGGSSVRTLSNTRYEGGSAADLALNVKVQVEGRVGSDGVIEARKVEIKDGGRVYSSN